MTGAKFDRRRESQKTIVPIECTTLTLCWVWNFIKIQAFAVLRPKLWPNRWQVPTLTGVNINRRQKLQKNIVTIEFTTLDLWRVRNFIKIEAFVILCPKLWPERWHVPTLTGVKNHRKLLSLMNSAPSNCSLCKISWRGKWLTSFSVPSSPFPVPLFKDSL